MKILPITDNTMARPTQPTQTVVSVSDKKYEEISQQYGGTWYFVNPTTIKYYTRKDTWSYAKVL